MSRLDYWRDTFYGACEEAGIDINTILPAKGDLAAKCIEDSVDQSSMYFGDDVADANRYAELKRAAPVTIGDVQHLETQINRLNVELVKAKKEAAEYKRILE